MAEPSSKNSSAGARPTVSARKEATAPRAAASCSRLSAADCTTGSNACESLTRSTSIGSVIGPPHRRKEVWRGASIAAVTAMQQAADLAPRPSSCHHGLPVPHPFPPHLPLIETMHFGGGLYGPRHAPPRSPVGTDLLPHFTGDAPMSQNFARGCAHLPGVPAEAEAKAPGLGRVM
jgi:hypothetical protein